MENKWIKLFGGIIATILLGAIGSGVWEILLSPLSKSAVSNLASFFGFISNSYANSLYSDVGKGSIGVIGILSMYPYALIQSLFICLPIFYLTKIIILKERFKLVKRRILAKNVAQNFSSASTQNDHNKIFSFIKYFNFFIYPISTLFLIYILSTSVRNAYAYDVVIYLDRSIDIVSPFISDHKLKEIKSEYRQIDSRDKFNLLNKKIINIADSNKASLPEISLLKIK